jgi:redox-sensitive bicupin YhaK (pirin superfamily)
MITLRPASERGHNQLDWLDSRHTFSFGHYMDPRHMGFRALRVINDDLIAPDSGFGMHGHRDMEIISWILEGELEHRDSLGHREVLRPGEVQHMGAGRGIRHSEFNPSPDQRARLIQIWIEPEAPHLDPVYKQQPVDPATLAGGGLVPLVTRDGRGGSIRMRADADLYVARLHAGAPAVVHPLAPGRHGWVQVTRGTVRVNGHGLADGDGLALSDEPTIELASAEGAEVLVFDLK